ncbi:MAG: hypothetical protein IJB91_07340 [Oscillospiraceae bacterium]|nr:hypothetical protein [Oscillospiraceae bacterium]
MKRRSLCLMLAMVLLLLSGCGSSTNTDPTGGTSAAGTDIYHQKVMERMAESEFTPPYEGKPWIEHDPNRRIYISLGGQDCDFYPNTNMALNQFTFWIISLDKIDPSRIQLDIPMQTAYEVGVTDCTEMTHGTVHHEGVVGNFGLTQQQYFCMANVDFQERERLGLYASICGDLYREFQDKAFAENMTREEIEASEEYQFYKEKNNEYNAKNLEPSKQYKALTKEEVPKFYAYWVHITFPGLGSYEETVEELTVIVEDSRYAMEIGQWRFHTQTPQEILDAREARQIYGVGGGTGFQKRLTSIPSPEGYDHITFYLTGKEDLVITGVDLLEGPNSTANVVAGRVQIYEEDESGREVVVLEYLWDTKTPLEFKEGQNVRIDLCIQDDRVKEYEVGFTRFSILRCTYRGQPCAYYHEHLEQRDGHPWEIYLMAFAGVDVGEYYHYHQPVVGWYKDIPAEWLNP